MVNFDKLSHEIFSILEAQFLFGNPPNNKPKQTAAPALAREVSRIRILSVDAASPTDSQLAAASLACLESALHRSSSLPDLFDLAAGSSHDGLLVSLLFTRVPDSSPLFCATDAFAFLADLSRPPLPPRGLSRLGRRQVHLHLLPGPLPRPANKHARSCPRGACKCNGEQQLFQPRITQTPNNHIEEEYKKIWELTWKAAPGAI